MRFIETKYSTMLIVKFVYAKFDKFPTGFKIDKAATF